MAVSQGDTGDIRAGTREAVVTLAIILAVLGAASIAITIKEE
jgi:hypothetical protein